jgi:hypothetical protein
MSRIKSIEPAGKEEVSRGSSRGVFELKEKIRVILKKY